MRLAILDSGHGFGTKVFFAFIRAVSRQPVPDVVKLNHYRADFYGRPMMEVVRSPRRSPISRPRPSRSRCGRRCACFAS